MKNVKISVKQRMEAYKILVKINLLLNSCGASKILLPPLRDMRHFFIIGVSIIKNKKIKKL
jgi:hypothetical protein